MAQDLQLPENRITYKNIWTVAYPIVIGGLAENINNAINTAFVGHLGETAIGAVGMGGMFYFNFVVLILGLSAGAQIIIGRRNGERKFKKAGSVFTHALVLFIFMASALMLLLYFFLPYLLKFFISSPEIYSKTVGYTGIRIFGLLFIACSICFKAFFIGITKTRVITIITLVSAATNVVFDYFFIFGNGGFNEMGINGAAYASIIAEAVSMIGYIIAAFVVPGLKKYSLFDIKVFKPGIIGNVLKVGSPLMFQNWLSFSAWLLFFIFIEKMGARDLAVSSIIKSIYMLFLIPMWGFASATNTLTSNLIGQGRSGEVSLLLKKILLLTLGVMLVLIQVNLFFPREIIGIFSQDVGLIEAAVGPLWIISLALIFFSVSIILFNGISGAGDTRVALIIEIITISIYLIYIFMLTRIFKLSMEMVWTSEILYMIVFGILSYIRIRSGKWKKATV